ncbi:MAG: ABC transporter substrate-binding protein [Chloroflexi bacterium]|nr:ABC transporter substrate-binding protein [Chloroflexota bacterium]
MHKFAGNFFRALGALGLAAPLLLLGSAARAAQPTQPSGTLVVDLTADPESLDPAVANQAAGFSVISSIFDNLVERDYQGQLQPMLAESWSFPSPNTIEFALRHGVTFQNGEPFNAQSVKFSVDRLLDPATASPLAGGWPKTFQGATIVDDYTVDFTFSTPDATIFDALAVSGAMLPPVYYSQHPADYLAANPVGTGPYHLVESVKDDHTTLAANTSYWGTSTYKGSPQVKTVVFRPVPDPATRVADLLNGTADLISDVNPDDVDALRARAGDGYQVVTGSTSRLQFVQFMPKKASDPLADRRVRQALNYAVDVDGIVQNLFHGLGTRQASPILVGALGYDASVAAYDYNPTYARQLLADAGYPNGFTATMDIASSDAPDEAMAVIGQLQKVGVNVTPHQMELAQFNANWSPDKSGDLRYARWVGLQDPAAFLSFTTACGAMLGDPFVCDQGTTAQIQQAAATLDQDARAGQYTAISKALHDSPMAIYLADDVTVYGVGPRVQGWPGPTSRDYILPTNITVNG